MTNPYIELVRGANKMKLQDKTYIIDQIYQTKQEIKQQKLLVQIVITLQLFSILLIAVDVLI